MLLSIAQIHKLHNCYSCMCYLVSIHLNSHKNSILQLKWYGIYDMVHCVQAVQSLTTLIQVPHSYPILVL